MSDNPVPHLPDPDRPFEVGIVMAGAISAGAYTAGVIDFLLQALDEWEKAKAHARANPNDPSSHECPPHSVRIKVLAGASAGGMTAGIAAGLLGMEYESVTHQTAVDQASPPLHPVNNTLYRSWVNSIDIDPLLGTKDLDDDPSLPVQSVLDSSILIDIADGCFDFEAKDKKITRPYVDDPLHVLLTVTNLRGIPYPITFSNFRKINEYVMTMHADNMHFVVSQDTNQAGPEAFWLEPYAFQDKATWGVLQTSALATGAFPFGLAPRLLARPPAHYEHRTWTISTTCEADPDCYSEKAEEIPPLWPLIDAKVKSDPKFSYEFLCVDGGVMNNEPLDLAREILAGPEGVNPREGDKATRAVIMVMPFPNAGPFPVEYDGQTNLIQLLPTMFNCLISQARFKPEELTAADDPDVYSRFLIVPLRRKPDGTPEPYAIACGSLEGFGGFLSRRFREHDYQLGRRNCQWFLRQYFALPSEGGETGQGNRLFENWSAKAREKHKIVLNRPDRPGLPAIQKDLKLLPIIPLLGTAAPDVPQPVWPTFTQGDFDALRPKIRKRLRRVVFALINQNVQGWFWGPITRLVLKIAWFIPGFKATNSIMGVIKQDLKDVRKLMK